MPTEMLTFVERMEWGPGNTSELIECYVLGLLSADDRRKVEAAASRDDDLRSLIDEMQSGFELLARINAVAAPKDVKRRVLEAVQDIEHENRSLPPVINPRSVAADFACWLDLPEMVRPADAEDTFFIPFADNINGLSAVVWLVTGSPKETHDRCVEKFLILEGSCEIEFPDKVCVLKVGDVLSIPLHTPHSVKVTSTMPCKIILQRIAA